ncbi:sensor histidine kinase [Sporosarcina sp. 6E9]|uniref:sensor histidine kinase n=1 Tax=Sporosarcina sp. 6E9 TaxID=2819235 RepID=UPI001B30277C|nr:histidine kinase [Sporosarcina sp. 6E9]
MLRKKKRSFKEATRFLFLKYTVIPIFVVMILFCLFTIFVFKIKIVHDANKSAKNVESGIMAVYNTYIEEINRMSELDTVITNLRTKRNNHMVYEEFYNFNNRQEVKSVFHLVDNRDVILASTTTSKKELDNEIINEIIPSIERNLDEILIDARQTQYSHGKTTVFTIGKAIKREDQILGYLVFQLFEKDLQRLIFGEKADIVVVTDKYDQIIVSTNSIVKGLMNKFIPEKTGNSEVKIMNERYFMNEIVTANKVFTIYTLKNVKYGSLIIILYIIFILVVCGLLFFLLRSLAEKMSAKNVESIDKLFTAVSRLETGDMKSYVKITTGDEFEVLANRYNSMLDRLNELNLKNKELSEIRRKNEIKMLQSQFNPHFIFNVLETLRYTMFVNIEQAQEIIFSISRLLRYSINNDENNVPFEKDLDYILDYLKLHKFRFKDRLEYTIEVEPEVKKIYVPKLLLQPIIENAINYGYRRQTHLQITIRGVVIGDYVSFTVEDNGGGIDQEKLTEIRVKLYDKVQRTGDSGIGLENSHRRVILQYGEEYGLTIESIDNAFTKVNVKIPYSKGADNDV